MDENFKKIASVVVIGSLGATIIAPVSECGDYNICALENAESPHTHQEEHTPINYTVQTMSVTATSTVATQTFVQRGRAASQIVWKGING